MLGLVQPKRCLPATRPHRFLKPWRIQPVPVISPTEPPASYWATETNVVRMVAGQMVAQPV
jgi:hypothetical protein